MDAILCKIFSADVSKVLHHPAAIGGCDLGDCYDRGAHPPTSIGLRAWGIPKPAIAVMLTAFQTMKFCLRTGFGESKEFFGRTAADPILGYGQGSEAGPPSFSCLSSLIINAYKRMGNGAKLTSCYAARIFLLAAAMYVDDTDLLHWGSSPTVDDDELIAQVQKSTDDFSALAEASSGCLKPEKCFVYFMLYQARAGIMRMKSLRHLPPPTGNIEMKQANGSMEEEP